MLKLFRFLKPYKTAILVIFILVFFQSMSDLFLPTLMSDIVNTGIINGDVHFILKTGGFMLGVALFGSICAILSSLLSSQVSMGLGRIIRSRLFEHVTNFSLHEFDIIGTPSLITRTTNDITQVQNVSMMIARMMIMAPITCIGGIIMAVSTNRDLAWIIVVVIPLLLLFITIVVSKVYPLFKLMQKKIDRINQILREGLIGIRVIRAFNRSAREHDRFEEANNDLTDITIRVNRIMAVMMPGIMLFMNLSSVAVIWFGGIRIEHGATNIGDMMAFLQYMMQIMFAVIMASLMFIMLPRAQASAARINEALNMKTDILDPEVETAFGSERATISFENVSFHYKGAEQAALEGISFSTSVGEVTAIIGSTGCGKSTLVNLIARFYDPGEGCIRLNGTDIREVSQSTLRSRIGFVPQKAVLFNGTVEENIRYGKPDASPEDIRWAAEISQSLEFINQMKEGFSSLISQGGTNVSGGQKQRLSIARALVGRPEVYVFDDSFSALDFKTDSKLRADLKKETKDSTVIIVGQRVATIMDADRIIVLDEGRMVGMGTHRELLESCPVYQEIVYSQLTAEEAV